MRITSFLFYIIFTCVLLTSSVLAQEDTRPLLADVELQKIFIDANKEKILERYQDAAYLYKEVLKKDPKNHAAAYELARMYDVLNKNALALKTIEKAIRLAPENVWYKDVYALILERNEKYDKAASVYGGLAKKHPDNEYFLFQQAFYYVKARKPEKAVVIYDKLERLMGINEELTQKKYMLYYGMKDTKKAVKEIKKLIQAFPESTNYLHLLADFYTSSEQSNKAKEVYRKILKINPQDAEAKLAMAEGIKKGGNHLAYLQSIRPTIEDKTVNIDLKVKELSPYILMLKESKDEDFKNTALSLGKILTEIHPKEAKARSLYADMLYYAGQTQEALTYYQSILKLDPSVYAVWEQILYLKLEAKDYNSLIEVSEEAMDLFPNQAKLYYLNGVAQSILNRHTEAIDMLEQALMMAGKKASLKYDICNRLGVEYAYLKKYKQSNKKFERALKINPKGYSALHNYSYHLALRNTELTKAERMAALANEIKKDQPLLLANLGRIYFLLKNYKQAEAWIEKSMKNGGAKIPEVLEVYGDVLFQKGKKDEARQEWKKAKELGGNAKELDKKIEQVKS